MIQIHISGNVDAIAVWTYFGPPSYNQKRLSLCRWVSLLNSWRRPQNIPNLTIFQDKLAKRFLVEENHGGMGQRIEILKGILRNGGIFYHKHLPDTAESLTSFVNVSIS